MLIILALTVLASVGSVISCGNKSISGTYTNDDFSDEYLKLNEDSTFYLEREYGSPLSGHWEVNDDELKLSWNGSTVSAPIRGSKIYETFSPGGRAWVKQ
jgi:hypothetical protein